MMFMFLFTIRSIDDYHHIFLFYHYCSTHISLVSIIIMYYYYYYNHNFTILFYVLFTIVFVNGLA